MHSLAAEELPSDASPTDAAPPSASDILFHSLLTLPGAISNADSSVLPLILFIVLTVLGIGLLVVGSRFEKLLMSVSLGMIMYVALFVFTYIAIEVNEEQTGETANFRDWPLVVAAVVTIALLVVLRILFCLLSFIQPLLDFLVGFVLGAVLCLVGFIFLMAVNDFAFFREAERDLVPVYLFGGLAVLISVIFGVIGIYFLPIVGVALRCAAGGFMLAEGVQGIVGIAGGEPIPSWAFFTIFGVSAGAGLILQLFVYGRKPKQGVDESTPLASAPAADAKEDSKEVSLLVNK